MKKVFFVLILIVFFLMPWVYAEEIDLNKCVGDLGKIQGLIEYFYMEFGEYPASLKDMEKIYNEESLVKDQPKIIIPKDPASGKDYFYEVKPDGLDYTLKVPSPEVYGQKKIELNKIDWGWMQRLAGEERRQALLQVCVAQMKKLATSLELYAKDNKGNYPAALKDLIPNFEKEIYKCPACSKEYIYTKLEDSYELACPEPQKHKLKALKYNSNKGLTGE